VRIDTAHAMDEARDALLIFPLLRDIRQPDEADRQRKGDARDKGITDD